MKKKLLIFDLDGVLINSQKNMQTAWNKLNQKFELNISFINYFDLIGIPFKKILLILGIKKNHIEYKNYYDSISNKNIKNINLYPGVFKTLEFLKKQKIKLAIVTSKDEKRAKKIIKIILSDIKFDLISFPSKKYRSKPNPDLILNTMASLNVDPDQTLFCGDMRVDFEAAKRAKVTFVFAKYGFGKNFLYKKNNIFKFSEIKKFI